MNKSGFVDAVAEHSGFSKTDAKRAVDSIFDTDDGVIATSLKKGEEINLTGFGKFETRSRGARTGRNPQTGEEIQIKASTNPAFKSGAGLKKTVGGG